MRDKQSHYILVKDLMEDAREFFPEINNEDYTDLFYGHLHLLKDNGVIKEVSGVNLGISYGINGQIITGGCFIRLTSKGYDFAKVLNKNEILEKLKRFTLNEALQITNAVLANTVSNCIVNFT